MAMANLRSLHRGDTRALARSFLSHAALKGRSVAWAWLVGRFRTKADLQQQRSETWPKNTGHEERTETRELARII